MDQNRAESGHGSSVSEVEKTHRGRRIAATCLGGLGVVFFVIGIAVMTVFGFVASATATQKTVESAMSDQAIREVIADEVVNAIEESGETPTEKIVFSLARPFLDSAVARAIDSPKLQKFIGEISFKAYEVFVDEKPATSVDVSPVIDVAVDAIKKIDPRVAENFVPKVKPLELKRDADSPDLRTIRDDVKTGMWVVLLVGVLLHIASWFLAHASRGQKLSRLGIRLSSGGIMLVMAVALVRNQASSFSVENPEVAQAVTDFVSSPVMARGVFLVVVGSAAAVAGWAMHKKVKSPVPM